MVETRLNWTEQDGEVLPSYTGPNTPIYPNTSPKERLEELKRIHPQFSITDTERGHTQPAADIEETDAEEIDVDQIRADIRGQLPPAQHPPHGQYLEDATRRYVDGRKDILG